MSRIKRTLALVVVVGATSVGFAAPPQAEAGGGIIGSAYQCPAHLPVLRIDWTGFAWCAPY